ncbi:hypothetical protein F5884DRAFT_791012 [Xylogone sp. PMI_703]|nr:hypothetical protein F5884DRAFT_791012 [Xylogone sp. PMI_703]
MKTYAAVILSVAALASAQGYTTDPSTGAITCSTPNAVYCAGDSLKTNIIIRCTGTVGQAGNCNDNLVGEPPVGNNPSECWASGPASGVAACAKNGIVYGSSGNANGTFPVPGSTTSVVPTGASSVVPPLSTGTGTGGSGGSGGNGTSGGGSGGNGGGSGTATNTPVGPSSTGTQPPQVSGNSASANRAGGALAVLGLAAAYLL